MTNSRIAVVSDIHGNLPAPEAVWAEIERAAPALVVNLGDIASGPLWPRGAMADGARGGGTPALAHDRRQPRAPMPGGRRRAHGRLGRARVTRAGRAEARVALGVPTTQWLLDDVLPCRGTPGSDVVYFMETVVAGFGVDGLRAATAAELAERAAQTPTDDMRSGLAASLILCGPTHVPRAMALPGGPRVVNPGSVGLQADDDVHPLPHFAENGSPGARRALVERDRQGAWHVQLRTTPCDWRAAVAQAQANGRGDWADALASGVVGGTEPPRRIPKR